MFKITLILFTFAFSLSQAQVFDHTRSQKSEQSIQDSLEVVNVLPVEKGAAEVTFLDGSLRRQPMQEVDWLQAGLHSSLMGGDKVRTGVSSRAEIELGKDNVLRLAPETLLDIRKLVSEDANGHALTEIHLEDGDLWAELEGIEDEDSFSISSNLVGAAITGTTLRVGIAESGETTVRVYHGEVKLARDLQSLKDAEEVPLNEIQSHIEAQKDRVAAKNAAAKIVSGPTVVSGPTPVAGPREVSLEEWMVIVRDMQELKISADGRIGSAGEFSAEEASETGDWVRWNKLRRENQTK
jgi:hypothetical protein